MWRMLEEWRLGNWPVERQESRKCIFSSHLKWKKQICLHKLYYVFDPRSNMQWRVRSLKDFVIFRYCRFPPRVRFHFFFVFFLNGRNLFRNCSYFPVPTNAVGSTAKRTVSDNGCGALDDPVAMAITGS